MLKGEKQSKEVLDLVKTLPLLFYQKRRRNKALAGQTMAWNLIGHIGGIGGIGCNDCIGRIGCIVCIGCIGCIG